MSVDVFCSSEEILCGRGGIRASWETFGVSEEVLRMSGGHFG